MYFNDSKKVGDKAEMACAEFLRSHGFEPEFAPDTYFPYFDMSFAYREKVVKFEVKNDVKACETGNIAIEYCDECREKNTGISITEAHYYYISTCDTDYIVRTDTLKQLCENAREVRGGDNNCSVMKLIPRHIIEYNSSKIIKGWK